jgi:hypothetical protein
MEDRIESYELPTVADYGSLQDLTEAGAEANTDVPFGNANTAYPVAS